jgi:tagatose 1,6-diphosphate aldolase GatY/KbaY
VRDRGTGTLTRARDEGWALGAFSTYTQEITQAICRAAEETGQPVLIQAGASAFAHAGRDELAAQALLAADLASVPVGVHLDHSRDLAEIEACLQAGYTSVMVDGSHLSFEDNVALTRQAVAMAAPFGAWVEGELGAVPGDEDVSRAVTVRGELTDPARAEEFTDRTGIDALAVAVGNVHGTAAEPTPLDLRRLAAIAAVVPVPLVLHGASGLPVHELTAARALGVAKVNVNTELRIAFLAALSQAVPDVTASADVARALGLARAAVQAVVGSKISALTDIVGTEPAGP